MTGATSVRGRLVMTKVLFLGAAALALSAASALADGSAEPAPPAEGYAAPAPPPAYTAPQLYAAPVYTAPQVYVVPVPVYAAPLPAPVYAAPLPAPVYTAPVVSRPIYAYAPGYWGGYGHGWHGYGHGWHGYGHRWWH
jgi:hypothetical protein